VTEMSQVNAEMMQWWKVYLFTFWRLTTPIGDAPLS
jgi:hypothetical protein